jgi:Zn-dependent peptidase ImmA (M78 family)/transcriptional regulator with XRE-family HTH domain
VATAESTDLAFVNPRVLSWALNEGGVPRATVAQKLKISPEQLASWETRGQHPPFAKAQALANVLRIPFGYLFLPEPPSLHLPLPDFRNFDQSYKPSPNLLELLNDVLVKQDWYRDLLREQKATKLKFVGSFTSNDDVTEVAGSIRETLRLSRAFRSKVKSWADHVSKLAKQAEEARILVMRSSVVGNVTNRPISVKEMQGFAIADDMAPLVFVNSADFKAPQVFTLAHELAHIWIGQSGIDNPDETKPGRNKVEAFSNRVAAEVLVPEKEFLPLWRSASLETSLEVVVREFWVSAFVILRRAHDLGILPTAEYERLKASEAKKVTKGAAKGGDYYRNVPVRMGGRFTSAVLGEVNRGTLSFRDGARLVGVKVPSLLKMAEGAK